MYHNCGLFDSSYMPVGALRDVNMSAFVSDHINPRYWYFYNLSMTYTAYRFEIE